jgi:hypothetical protein
MDLQQGSCIRLAPDTLDSLTIAGLPPPAPASRSGAADQPHSEQLYQVIGVDHNGDRCWLRRWPLARQGSPVFEISLHQLQTNQPLARGHHRPSATVCGEA